MGGSLPAAALIDQALPQTQCTRCGEPDCASYAQAIANGAPINRCPPGGAEGIVRLASLTGRGELPLDAACGQEGARLLAWIDESACIGCTLCIKACPVDCIIGAPKRMHTVVAADCTGCELCVPVCPVDCIHLEAATPGRSGWAGWSTAQAQRARLAYHQRNERRQRSRDEEESRLAARAAASLQEPVPPLRDAVQAALKRAMERRGR